MLSNTSPFLRFIPAAHGGEQDAVLGFSLPFLPDMLTSRWLIGANVQERLREALSLQMRLVATLWSSGVTALDLRFVGTDELPGVAIGLLCRLHRLPHIPPTQFHAYSVTLTRRVQQLFADFGYELQPLVDERSLLRYIHPFRFQAVAEIRKREELYPAADTYTEYECYVTYPWSWTLSNRLRLFEALLQRQGNCLVSIYLEPAQLSPQERAHLSHATSAQMKELLVNSGSKGQAIYNTYRDYERSLRQPYLLRIGLAASAPQSLERVGRMFIDELHTSQIPGTEPVLEYPRNAVEWEQACYNLSHLVALPWGYSHGMDMPGTARLRSLVDERTASMAFRLPVAHPGDIPGVPVRSLAPTSGTPGAPGTTPLPLTPSTSNSPTFRSPHATSPASVPPSDISDIRKPEDLVGKLLGTCQIEALLGRGGFGAVYRATQPRLQRVVAVKVVLAAISNANTPELRKLLLRFDREALAVARMDHPHILTLHEYQPEPLPYIVMPYMAGGSLSDEIQASGNRPLQPGGVLTILNQVALALDHAHAQHIVHRDMKPANLLRHQDGRVMLSDFGIVLFEGNELPALTTDKRSPHTPAYASPEQQLGQPVDHRSDIYSLGIIVYELLCGRRPFNSPYAHVTSPPPAMSTFGIQVHPALEAVVVKALAKEPGLRYQSAGQFAAAFQSALTQN